MSSSNEKKYKFVAVVGYGRTGSGAVVDLLKEFDGYWECGREFRLLRDPYGIFDLEHSVVNTGDWLNADVAIKDFWWLAQRLYRKTKRLGGTGCGYIDVLGPDFLLETEKYIKQLSHFEFQSHWWWFEFKQSNAKMAFNRIMKRLHLSNFEDENKIVMADIDENNFIDITKQYLINLYASAVKWRGNSADTIILDQSFSLNRYEQASRYFDNLKVIVVDRDPRDNYINILNDNFLIGRELVKTHDVDKFIQYYKYVRKNNNICDNANVHFVKFEELILNYEKTVAEIIDFLEEGEEIHTRKYECLKPEESKKNIGIWKNYQYQDKIKKIECELM